MSGANYERVPVEDWSAVTDHLRKFGEDGEVSEGHRGMAVTVGRAQFSVTKDGRVATEMPLHEFENGGVEALYFDHERGAIRVEDGDRSYEFRKPA